jgi:hypothetical protein
MARQYGQIKVSIWVDDDFLDLSPMAQWLFIHLSTHADLSHCGVVDWRLKRIVPKATGLTIGILESAAQELIENVYIIADEDTEEVLVRSFMRSDGLLKQRNMGAAVAKAYASVSSRTIRGVVVHELHRLKTENPEWTSWGALKDALASRSINPREMGSSEAA